MLQGYRDGTDFAREYIRQHRATSVLPFNTVPPSPGGGATQAPPNEERSGTQRSGSAREGERFSERERSKERERSRDGETAERSGREPLSNHSLYECGPWMGPPRGMTLGIDASGDDLDDLAFGLFPVPFLEGSFSDRL